MTNYLPLIFGISSLLLGIYLFLVFFGIYKPKTSEETEEKSENMKLMMKVISLILKGGYNVLNLDSDTYRINSKKAETKWSETAKDSLNKYCLIGMREQPKENSKINFDYCNCTSEKIMKTYTQIEYEKIIKKPIDEQFKVFSELVKDCKAELQKKIDSVETANK
ncbi:hypothetical protein [Flavobacterium sp. Arc2]|uniref:hypothetical protein n=1 Tax=Flavobacterium sp. Arc2 TaxID=3046685 RepID=UPI00352D71DD